MKKIHQKIAKSLMACVMVGVLGAAPVMAGTIGDNGIYTGDDTTVTIGKDLAIYNDGYTSSWSPNINYTYSITPKTVAAGTTVTDSDGHSMTVKSGVGEAIVNETATVSFAAQEVTEASATTLAEILRGEINFEFAPEEFDPVTGTGDGAGIYRYEIEDTTSAATLAAAGVVRPDNYETTKQLDVYVVKNSTSNEWEIAGYVLLDPGTTSVDPTTGKDPGFRTSITPASEIPVPGTKYTQTDENADYGISGIDGDNVIDYYRTFNVTVDKTITGNAADPDHEFPFTAAISSANGTYTVDANHIYMENSSGAISAINLSQTATANQVSDALADGDQFTLYGLNPYAIVTVSETNDSGNTYVVTTSDGTLSGVDVNNNTQATAGANAVATYSGNTVTAGTNNALNFTNNCESNPPTGVMLAVAPFVAVAALVGAMIGVSKFKSKKQTDVE